MNSIEPRTIFLIALAVWCLVVVYMLRAIWKITQPAPQPKPMMKRPPKMTEGGAYEHDDGSITSFPWGDDWDEQKSRDWQMRKQEELM
jgi:hypothetical protein